MDASDYESRDAICHFHGFLMPFWVALSLISEMSCDCAWRAAVCGGDATGLTPEERASF
jgi:hypothetical protein